MDDPINRLVGKTIKNVYMSDEYLKFDTDQGEVSFNVYGDCCSNSYFYDFIGVEKLLNNGPIISAKAVDLDGSDPRGIVPEREYYEVQVYGYEIVTEDPKFGPVTTVFSFRNSSNGYYGGSLESCSRAPVGLKQITKDVLTPDDLEHKIIDIERG